ncbi:DNA-3-methyladenine glycosylase I [Arcanobacterium haemolyticum]|nr:DNA-3-methyladenine glycosylase I [Arcanobacterium haemolyticum]
MNHNDRRPAWADEDPLLHEYYEHVWGRPLHDEHKLFAALSLEVFQTGLSWLTILKKEDLLFSAFDDFVPDSVAQFDQSRVEQLLVLDGMIRNRRKIEATIRNARAVLRLRESEGFSSLVWTFACDPHDEANTLSRSTSPESHALSRRLHEEGFTMVGPTNTHAFMQTVGMIDQAWTAPWREGFWDSSIATKSNGVEYR